jgi:glycosyltransferase involved in cell wall biosynthesis
VKPATDDNSATAAFFALGRTGGSFGSYEHLDLLAGISSRISRQAGHDGPSQLMPDRFDVDTQVDWSMIEALPSCQPLRPIDPAQGVRLVIQIPCLNERDQLPGTFAELPRAVAGVDAIEILVIDDGSVDGTSEVATQLGVHHIVRFSRRRGLAAAHMAGLDAALRLGADIVVNTDADNQYRGQDIEKLVAPLLRGEADITVGDRGTNSIAHFSWLKRLLQRWGSALVRQLSGTAVVDSTSGFRAMNRKALYTLFVHNAFSYTLESIIQAGEAGLMIGNVPITTNAMTRKSRLFSSIPEYLRRNGPVIFRAYATYRPMQTFGIVALVLLVTGLALGGRFLYYYVTTGGAGHIQSVQAAVGAVVLAFIVGLMALLGDMLAANRRLDGELIARIRRLDAALAGERRPQFAGIEGVISTGAEVWRPER